MHPPTPLATSMKAGIAVIMMHKLDTVSPNRYTYTILLKMHKIDKV